jgi:predicted DNA-binding transcriptional regulator YafY
VTVRTIYRDLDALRDADLPLGAERGRGGGYALDRHYALPPVNFTAREAALLVAISQHAIDMRLLPFEATLGAGLEKVRAALSASAQRELLQRLSELAFLGVPALPSAPNVRSVVERAWFEERALRITYVDGDHVESTREVRLRQVIMNRHDTRLDIEDLTSGERRQLRLDRITRASLVRLSPL